MIYDRILTNALDVVSRSNRVLANYLRSYDSGIYNRLGISEGQGSCEELKIVISPEIRNEVSPPLIEFVKTVIKEEQLGNWNVHIWQCRGEGLCDDTTIMFGPCEFGTKTKLLFLHEVAHALRSSVDLYDSYWHKDGWGKEFDRLCKKYLGVKNASLSDLFHDRVG